MTVQINGSPQSIEPDLTIAQLVEDRCGPGAQGVAVAVNGSVLRKSQWEQTAIEAGDEIEILHATSGG